MELKLREEVCGDGVTVNSPIGQKLIGKKTGDKFQAYTPGGIVEVEILGVNAGDALP
jgi:transcription elongation GreA/GreB family factor